jgi:hypothetical protein
MSGKLIRATALVIMLVFYAILLLTLWIMGQLIFFWVFVGIGCCVGAGEVVSVIRSGKTLSTNFTKAMQDGKFWLGIISLSSLLLAIASLVVHLLPWK